MKNTTTLIIILAFIAAAGATATLAPPRINGADKTIGAGIMKKCDALGHVECGKSCADGWEITGYYDSRKGGKLESPVIRAIQTIGVCKRCYVRFTVHREKGFDEVTCEEFYQYIEKENSQCGDCLVPTTLPLQQN